jgi:hypothetical protein
MKREVKGEAKDRPRMTLINVEGRRNAEDQQAEADARNAARS